MKNLTEKSQSEVLVESSILDAKLQRRSFLQYAGAGAAALALTAAGCKKDGMMIDDSAGVNLGSGDVGILNVGKLCIQCSRDGCRRLARVFALIERLERGEYDAAVPAEPETIDLEDT